MCVVHVPRIDAQARHVRSNSSLIDTEENVQGYVAQRVQVFSLFSGANSVRFACTPSKTNIIAISVVLYESPLNKD